MRWLKSCTKYKESNASHIVVIGPNAGFDARATDEFKQLWSIEGVVLSDFNGHERGPYSGGGRGGVTGDLEGSDCW